jgi:hypothetical protein
MSDDLIELESICTKYFGIIPRIARRKAALGTLPIPAFRLGSTRKGPLFVRKTDLEGLITERAKQAEEFTEAMRSVMAG